MASAGPHRGNSGPSQSWSPAWYRVANATPPPAGIHYYNFYTDIQVKFLTNYITRQLPMLTQPLDMGDTVILPGSGVPTDHNLMGGASFNPCSPGAYDCHNYLAPKTRTLPAWDAFLGPAGTGMKIFLDDSYSHNNFGSKIDLVTFDTCSSNRGVVTASEEIVRILRNPANACS